MSGTEILIANYWLLAVFVGGLLEGETILILAAVAAHHGLLPISSVFIVATCAAAIGDQIWFLLGRYGSELEVVKRLVAKPGLQRTLGRLERHPKTFVLSFRFFYGIRIAGAVACGLSRIPTLLFIILNLLAAMVWTSVILGLGYTFGSAMEAILGEAKQIEWKLAAAVASLVSVFVVFRIYSKRRGR
ncbi:DedA family protein [Oceanibium sediminis]|uniref:DedA family protein n=1 Tax=Oceanibium sediminis TaxID=2026339 RepID=UPI000DD4B146|nr:DedA family protein [Oceanibium sediminis]